VGERPSQELLATGSAIAQSFGRPSRLLFLEIVVTIAAAAAVLLHDQPTAMMNTLWNEIRTASGR
jgi:hypothetical protein